MAPMAHQKFAELFVTAQGKVYRYILTLVPHVADAEDLFQQTSLTLWEKWEQYDPTAPFMPWACGIARNHIRNHIRKAIRQGHLVHLSERLMERIADIREQSDSGLEKRRGALGQCLQKLSDKHRQMLDRRYDAGASIENVASEFGLSIEAAYKTIQRIRRTLHDCIRVEISSEGSA